MDTKTKKIVGMIIGILLVLAVFYWLSDLIVYTLVAILVSMLGRPLVRLLHKRLKIPSVLCSIMALVVIIGIFSLVIWLIFPLFLRQVQQLADIDYNRLSADTSLWVDQILSRLNDKGISISKDEINGYLFSAVSQLWQRINVESVISSLVGKLSSICVGIFSVIFISFFFLRDEKMLMKMLFLVVPDQYVGRVEKVAKSSEYLLNRYFVGLSIEVLCMMTLLSFGLWICGVDNALLYGCVGGMLNIIPYLGPVIGTVLACLFAIFNNLGLGISFDLLWMLLKIIGVFVAGNLIDNLILQVTIYSNSVKAHPLEIFFVILISGYVTGIWGMILAIPFYTVLRIFAKVFFKDTKLVRALTKSI
ncbi:MAG: AI-2E family transporter [Bacteroidales bacterium]|nr:AI-2E family transporter [Bacteroidales bacterium]MDE7072254.1 AI-2E family transporter [Bacteroidales bacterium]